MVAVNALRGEVERAKCNVMNAIQLLDLVERTLCACSGGILLHYDVSYGLTQRLLLKCWELYHFFRQFNQPGWMQLLVNSGPVTEMFRQFDAEVVELFQTHLRLPALRGVLQNLGLRRVYADGTSPAVAEELELEGCANPCSRLALHRCASALADAAVPGADGDSRQPPPFVSEPAAISAYDGGSV